MRERELHLLAVPNEDSDGSDSEAARDRALRRHVDRKRVEDWYLVLTAEGFRASMHRGDDGGFVLRVPEADARSATRALEQWETENARGPADEAPPPTPVRPIDRFAAGVVSLAMLAFFARTGPRNPAVKWFADGSADGGAILGGELWRVATALCLHADFGHVASNALFGAVFLSAAAAGYGPGVAILLSVAAGCGGNLANALFQGPDHSVVGASTAVFGTVGLLAARALAIRLRRGETGRRAWVPFAAGLAIIAMLGTGERSDVWAHAFGFGMGVLLGLPASLAWPRRATNPVQVAAAGLAAAVLAWSWRLALA